MNEKAGEAVYAGYPLAALALQYDIENSVADKTVYLRRYVEESAVTRQRRPAQLDVQYGSGEAEKLDIFPADDNKHAAPIVLFVHGGGWRGSNKESRAFPADLYCPNGAIWISLEYPLAPAHSLDQIVDSVRRGIAWVYRNAKSFNGDPSRIVLVGNSAGGHLAGVAATTDWKSVAGLTGSPIAGVITVSGVFDMRPLQLTHANDWLRMDDASVERNSPIRHIPNDPCPLIALVGIDEPDEFRRQTVDFAAEWAKKGGRAKSIVVEGQNHFSIIGLVGEAGNPVSAAVQSMLGLPHQY